VHERISVSVVPLKTLFSEAYQFKLPYFQRAYAWQTAEIGRLLTDIVAAMTRDSGERGYFLGKLSVAQKNGEIETALVDGHQRVMSLTILFAVLRDLESDPRRQELLSSFIRGTTLRLAPQDAMAATCERFVQAPGATWLNPDEDPDEDPDALSETERNVIDNRDHLRAELSSSVYTPEIRRALVSYLAEKCCVIVSSVEDVEEAWNFLKTEEETRVDFSKADRAKFHLFAIAGAQERGECQAIWSACEAMIGPEDMHALLGHLRTIKKRRQSGKPVESDIAESYALNKPGACLSFLRNDFQPAAMRLANLRRGTDKAVRPFTDRLSWIDPQLWVPAALQWLQRPRPEAQTALFFKRLDRLVWMMKIAGFDPTKQTNRIIDLLGEIDKTDDVSKVRALDVSGALRVAALSNLRSTTFDAKHYCGRVLRRISQSLGQDPGPIEKNTLTLEHVLPRSFSAKSGWASMYPNARAVRSYSHRLGNLALLSPAENQELATLDWEKKRKILARSNFVLARRLADAPQWSQARILERTEEMIGILFSDWEIKP
jgi:hypothetical protein